MRVNRRHRPKMFIVCCIICSALFLTVAIGESQALKPGEVSYTAEMAAGMRAVAAKDPDEKIRNPDDLAEKFLPPNFWFFSSWHKDYQKSKEFIKFYRVSGYYTVNAMTKHVDDILKMMAAKGLKQVVNIGAGFDSHPYRLGKQMPNVRFFEVDLPPTQKRKKEMVTALFGQLPATVTYVPIDYRTQTIFENLLNAGYDENLKTLFIWTGGMVYSDAKIVEMTLRSIAKHCKSESELVFSYIFDELVQGDFNRYLGAWYASVRNKVAGEPWKFGIAEGKAEEFVAERGFKVISDLGSKELAENYLVKSDGTIDGNPTSFVRIMHAIVDR
jgi:methyltransferase (TIGR00027 family)